jgi:type II secretory pathway component GspD/PulD (secretin)
MKITRIIAVIGLLAALGPPAGAQEADPLVRFQEALRLEETQGDLDAALAAYTELADGDGVPAGLRVRALVRVGACEEKLGRWEQAARAYDRVARDEGAFAEAVEQAEQGLERATQGYLMASMGLDTLQRTETPEGEERISFSVTDANVRALFLEIARSSRLAVVIAPEVMGMVTLSLHEVEPLEALRVITTTIGDYALIHDPSHDLVQILPRSLTDRLLELRPYRLVPRPASPVTVRARIGLLETIRELLAASSVVGSCVAYDPATQTLFVNASALQHPDIERLLGDELAPRAEASPSADLVTLDYEDANGRTVLELLASEGGGRPLLLSPEVSGRISLHAQGVPFEVLLNAVVKTLGDYQAVELPATTLIAPFSALDQWLEVVSWPLADADTLWNAGGYLLADAPGSGLPVEFPLEEVLREITAASGVTGAFAGLDPYGRRIVSHLTPPQRSELRRALVAAGYIDLPQATPASTPELVHLGSISLRAALAEVGRRHQLNVVLSPQVTGEVSGSYDGTASALDIMRALVRSAGAFEVVREGAIYRVLPLAALDQDLVTERLPLTERPVESVGPLAELLSELAASTRFSGALVVHNREPNFLAVTMPRPYVEAIGELVQTCDTRAEVDRMRGRRVYAHQVTRVTDPVSGQDRQQLRVSVFQHGRSGGLLNLGARDVVSEVPQVAVDLIRTRILISSPAPGVVQIQLEREGEPGETLEFVVPVPHLPSFERAREDATRLDVEARIEELFVAIQAQAEAGEVEELIETFHALRSAMSAYGEHGGQAAQAKLEAWSERLARFDEVGLSIQLQIFINEGNLHLRAMAQSLADEDYDLMLEHHTELQRIVTEMRAQEREVFHRNAAALEVRGQALRDRVPSDR